ncbi:MAG: hypothetical protein H0T68_10035 [Gemmatimonadales bacterium]|nr:hypothetical protein [Gemmatimonadales bacterium]
MRSRRIAPLATAALLGLARGASGQVTGSLDVGAGTYRPDRAIPGGIASMAPTLLYQGGRFRLGATGVYSDAPGGRWNFQATSFTQLRSPRLAIFEAEAAGQVDVTRHFRAHGTTAVTGELRLYAHPAHWASVWVGRGVGSALAFNRRRPIRRSQIGTSARVGGVELGFSLASTTFELMGGPLRSGDSSSIAVPGTSARSSGMSLTDAVLSSKWRVAATDVDLAIGRRFSATVPEITIWGVSAAREIAPQLALVAGAGRSGSDPVTSVPGSRYFVLGLRLKVGPAASTSFSPAPRRDVSPFRIGPALPAGREVKVRAPGANRVELAGDFTDWRPVELESIEDGVWRVVLPIPPGMHRLAVRIDEGGWQAPPGSRPIPNEFGGEVAEVVVE